MSKGSVGEIQLGLFEDVPVHPTAMSPDEIFSKCDGYGLQLLKENRRFERKPVGIHAKELCEYLSMWANTPRDGGVIGVGIDKDGALAGCRGSEEHVNNLETAGRNCCPDARFEIRHVNFEDSLGTNFILLIRVNYRADKLVKTGTGKAFIRRGSSKHELTAEEVRELESDKGQLPLEQEPCGLPYPDAFNSEAVREWANIAIERNGWDKATSPEQAMVSQKLGRYSEDGNFVPNLACALLFADDPRDVVPGCKIHFLRFEGETEGSGEHYAPVQDKFIHGNVPQLIVGLDTVLSAQLRTFTRLRANGKFYSEPEYPKLAWYEAVVNACAHRSYGLRNMNVFVKMFDDRLEIESPGPFPPTVTAENIYTSQHPRNPNLMEALWSFGFVQCNNEGTKRMRDSMAAANLPPPAFNQNDDSNYTTVKVTLQNNHRERKVFTDERAAAIVGAAIFSTLSANERIAINYISEKKRLKVSALQRLTGLTWPAAYELLLGLTERKVLHHVRKEDVPRDPGAYFELMEPPKK